MAKQKRDERSVSLKYYEDDHAIITKEDRQHKKQGLQYMLNGSYTVPGYSAPLPLHTTFVECNDGFYAIMISGEQMCCRLAPVTIESLQHILIQKNTEKWESQIKN